ncbi:MAG TPA: primosomal protein N', partial [Halothiobacillaceae bacterium]|nr:primosomal protein N' [Halothiobacillaceae bacterium]
LQHKPAVLHSGLADGARLEAWLAAGSNEAKLIVGTRSAAFVPLANPGLMVVDEEHDSSFKQQEGFMYHARDVLIYRAKQYQIPIVLGSATPSLETLRHALSGRYGHLQLSHRHLQAKLPKMQLIDQKKQPMQGGLSPALLKAIEQHLLQGGQVMLYLNRRGFAPSLLCHSCGYVAQCPHCDACMTLHRKIHRLRCHHCGHEKQPPQACPNCGAPLQAQGLGTEQLEDVLRSHFPGFPMARLDRDATARRGTLENTLAAIANGSVRIIVGTQMLVKGHDFPDVTLVAVVDADQGLFVADFHGPERFAQNLIQVAGRAGRAERPGTVLVQTHHPDHPVLNQLINQGYHAVGRELLKQRCEAQMPPYTHAALIRADSRDADQARSFLQEQAGWLRQHQQTAVDILGPITAPLARRAGRYRYQLLLISQLRGPLHGLLKALDDKVGSRRVRGLRWSIDIDPVDLS